MHFRFPSIGACCAALVLFSVSSIAAPVLASCNADFTVCGIQENVLTQLPFEAIAGDVVLTEPNSSTVSDVFRIMNNFIDTGKGTGLGDLVFLYSSDDTTLPSPSTYSANVVFITENPSGVTSYVGNGTNYLLGVPEPESFGLFLFAASGIAVLVRKRWFQGGLR